MFNVNGDSLPGPLIIATFEKRAPDTISDQLLSAYAYAQELFKRI